MNRINFTQKSIEQLPAPDKGKRAYYRDQKIHGLELMVTETGAKSFKVYRKVNNRPIRVTLGKYPDLSVEQARKKAAEVNAQLANGINPNEEKRKIRATATFGALFQKYLDEYAKPHTKTWQESERTIETYLKDWLRRPANAITSDDVKRVHKRWGEENGTYMANRMVQRISAIYNYALKNGWEGNNPTLNVKRYKEQGRDRFLLPEELPRFFEALEAEENTTARDYFYILLLTGARRSNVLSMRWDDIRLEHGEWRIPETKNGEVHTVPLVAQAVELLQKRKQADAENSPFVFQGTGAAGHLADPKKAWARILEQAEIENLRIHDLRRSLGSYQAILGANSYVIGKSLGHKSQAATAIYARMHLEPVRQSMENATQEMMSFKGGDSG